MGDVFEHLTREDARKFLENVLPQVEQIYIVVPWQMQQEAVDGNPHEEHQQEDLLRNSWQNYTQNLNY